MSELVGRVFITRKGWMGASASERGIAAVTQPFSDEAEAHRALGEENPDDIVFDQPVKNPLLERFAAKVIAFFEGQRVEFDEPVDLSGVPQFHREVLELVRQIPYGEVRSYGWVAQQIGRPKAARAVGQALQRNPVPVIVPCHRVIASNGKLQGFGWGIDFKEWLIGLEKGTAIRL